MEDARPILGSMGATGSSRPGNYPAQARTYDLTRAASPTVVRLLSRFLGAAQGRLLLEVAAGTGNYSQVFQARGFRPVLVDLEPQMLSRSVQKLGRGRQVAGDAAALPLKDEVVDCAMLTSALHLMSSPSAVFVEARRVLRQGPFVIQAFLRENMRHVFVFEYFEGSQPPAAMHLSGEEVERALRLAGFSRVEREKYVYLDTADGSLHALHTDPLRLAGPAYLRNTSFYQRLPEGVRREGLSRLETDLRSGVLQEKVKASFQEAVRTGHGTVFAAWP